MVEPSAGLLGQINSHVHADTSTERKKKLTKVNIPLVSVSTDDAVLLSASRPQLCNHATDLVSQLSVHNLDLAQHVVEFIIISVL